MTQSLLAVPIAERAAATRTVRVALAGCGVVGGHLLALLREHGANIARSRGLHFEISCVLVRSADRVRTVALPPHVVTTDVDTFLGAPADIVIEALGGTDPAGRIARAALAAGRHFVTANKALIAEQGPALEALSRRHGGSVAFEAAVAGGVPVIRVLRDALLQDDVRSVCGILNGTTNFILSHMERGATFTAALAAAQASGFAEADPSRDLTGTDAADKIRILAWLAFGIAPAAVAVERRGLLPDADALVAAATTLGGSVRLIAECVRLPDGVAASVEPVLVAASSAFARTAAADNYVRIDSRWMGSLGLAGAGAGGAPTASALLADALELARQAQRKPLQPASREPHRLPAQHAQRGAQPPPHDVAGVLDPRQHRWAVTLPATTRALDVLAAAGIDVSDVHRDDCSERLHVTTRRSSRARIDSALHHLTQLGITATRLRYALDEAEPQ